MPGIRLSTAQKVRRIGKLRDDGLGLGQIAERLDCSKPNICQLWKRYGGMAHTFPAARDLLTPLQCIQRRMALGWSWRELARRADVSMTSIWQFENEELNATHRWRGMID